MYLFVLHPVEHGIEKTSSCIPANYPWKKLTELDRDIYDETREGGAEVIAVGSVTVTVVPS